MVTQRVKLSQTLRMKVYLRDNFLCQDCQMTMKKHIEKYNKLLQIHHLDGNKKNNDVENLLTLCISCHNHRDVLFDIKENPELREKHRQGLIRSWEENRETRIQKISEAVKNRWKDPLYREHHVEGARRMWRSGEYKRNRIGHNHNQFTKGGGD